MSPTSLAYDDKLVHDVLEYLSALGEELPGLKGLWSHPIGVTSFIDSTADVHRVRRLLEKLMRADLVRDCQEPLANREGRRGQRRRMFQITSLGLKALDRLENGERIPLDAVPRMERAAIVDPETSPARKPRPEVVVTSPKTPDGVNPFMALYEAVEDYMEVAEPDLSPEYRALLQACALVRAYRARQR